MLNKNRSVDVIPFTNMKIQKNNTKPTDSSYRPLTTKGSHRGGISFKKQISEDQKGKISFLDSLGYCNYEYLEEIKNSPAQKKFMTICKQSDEDLS